MGAGMEVNMRAFQGEVRDLRLVHGPCPRNEGAARAEPNQRCRARLFIAAGGIRVTSKEYHRMN